VSDEHATAGGGGQDLPEELIREMARRLAETPVRDMLIQTMATFADLAGVRLGYGPEGAAHRDLPQARLAIESFRALIAVADAELGPALAKPFREPLAQLQMLYAREVEAATKPAEEADAQASDSPLWTPGSKSGGDGDSGLWTPSDGSG
jgi:hypothetical protein